MQRLLLLGLNHTTAPLEVREKLAFNAQQQRDALVAFRERFPNCEAVLVSTCNRVELYTARPVHAHPRVEEMIDFLSRFHGAQIEQFRPHLYEKNERAVVEHLFTVASSLDSMVLGETQILGQVRAAYDVSRDLTTAGPMLNPLFQRALAVGKQVMTETPLNEGRLSIASVAVDYARRIFDHFDDKTVLSIGAGKMAVLVLQHFAQLAPRRLLVCNRDGAKAQSLAGRFSGEAVSFDAMSDYLVTADVVVTSTGSSQPIVTKKQFETLLKVRKYRPIFIIDIAIPRDVEAAVGELDNVYLYNLDDLQDVVSKTQSGRTQAIDAARAIVTHQVDSFLAWQRTRALGPVIEALSQRYHELARQELERTLGKLPNITPAEREHLEDLTRRLVNKLLHDPITTLRNADTVHGPTVQYLHALEKLFHLKDDEESPGAESSSSPPSDEQQDAK